MSNDFSFDKLTFDIKKYTINIYMKKQIAEQINYWLVSSDRDWNTVLGLFKIKRYDYCLFLSHLTLEKLLKGLVVIRTEKSAPRIHDLPELANIAEIDLDENKINNLKIFTTFNISGRYDNIKFNFYKICTKEYTEKYLKIAKELRLCLKKQYPKK